MALQKRTIKIIAIVVVTLVIIAALLGIVLGLVLRSPDKVELEVWPRGASGAKDPLISFKVSDSSTYTPWIRRINETLSEYTNNKTRTANAGKIVKCDYGHAPGPNQICDVNIYDFFPCTAANNYNYPNGKPCVFLKLNKVPYWTPQPFNSTDSMPAAMPEDLKRYIKPLTGQAKANQVWVFCEGKDAADKDNMGSVQYIQNHGYPSYYFPYAKQDPYFSPLVAVMFEKPATGVEINVVCKAWAKNIVSEGEQSASVRFQLKVDS